MSTLRLSGLSSGMDTEAIVEQLMKAQRMKATKIENKITTTEWKQEKWKDLNSKIYSFYTKQLYNMRLQSTFMTKKAVSSNTNKVDATAGNNAPEGTHVIKVEQLASAQFVTGAKLEKDNNNKDISLNTKLVDLGFNASEGTTIKITTADKSVNLDVRANTTLGDFINALRNAGLNANYDTTHKRLFISSKTSGVENAFSITTSSTALVRNKNAIRDFLDYDSLSSSDKSKVDGYLKNYLTAQDKTSVRSSILNMKFQQVRESYINNYINDPDNVYNAENEVRNGIAEGESLSDDEFKAAVQKLLKQNAENAVNQEYEAWQNNEASDENIFKLAENKLDELLNTYLNNSNGEVEQSGSLTSLGLGEIVKHDDGTVKIVGDSEAELVNARDAVIVYNNVRLTGSSNNFTVNGLTLSLKGVTSADEEITVTVSGNTEAVYNTIKDFIKSYNELLTELNNAYYADSARGYDPLTDEQKKAMTEDEIKKWEDKIKSALLRRDDTVGSLLDMFRTTLVEGVSVNGKTYSLSNFGIASEKYTEKGILHISGDSDLSSSASDNKLMEALTNDPETVMNVFNKVAEKLYDSLMEKMRSTSLSSALTVYNDKEMAKTLTDYKKQLSNMEDKLNDMEDKYYRQFAAMESAMARMNSQSSYLASLFGSNKK